MRKLPPNVLPPTVAKADPDSDPVITLAVSGNRSVRELTEIADKQIRRAIETVDGVGARGHQRRPEAPDQRLPGSGQDERVQPERSGSTERHPDGKRRDPRRPHRARPDGTRRPNARPRGAGREFNDIIVKNVGGAPIRIRDVGYAEDGMAEKRTFALLQGPARGDARGPPADRHEHRQSRRRNSEAASQTSTEHCPPA